MIRTRTIAPLATIGAVSAILIGSALFFRGPDTIECWEPAEELPRPPEQVVRTLTAEQFPHFLTGTFLWDDSQKPQATALDIEETFAEGDLIVAIGRGTYTHYREAHFTFRIEADPLLGTFTMTESDPSVQDFITDGRHTGTFDGMFETMSARWLDDKAGEGTLTLSTAHASARPEEMVAHPETLERPLGAEILAGGVRFDLRHTTDRSDCVQSNQDAVTVHYSGWNDEGVFDDSWKRGQPATLRPSQVIKGWTTALNAMCVGDYARVWIPADQAYGNRTGRPAGDLVFDIEVLAISPPGHVNE